MTAVATGGKRKLSGQPPGTRRKKSPRSRFGLLAVFPFALFLIVFGIYPIIQLVNMAFSNVRIMQGGFQYRFIGLENFGRIFADPDTGPVVFVTIVFVLAAVVLTVVLGTGLALLLDKARFVKTVAKRVLIWPTVVAPVAVSVIWLLLLSPTIGAINKVLLALGLPEQGWLGEPVGAMLAIIFVDVWHWTPLVFLLVYTSLQSVDSEVLEAGRMDGASEWQLILKVILPIIRPAVFTAAAIRLLMSVKAFDEMFLLTHGGPGNSTNLISLQIRTIFFDRLEFGYGAAIGVAVILTFVVIGGIYMLTKKLMTRKEASRA